jgi:1,2-diacylglycerol 3-alpha-glucosyltransferase
LRKKVFLISTGVGHISRGYESFTVECFNQLKPSNQFELFLLKGAGPKQDHHITIACIKRNSKFASFLNRVTKKDKYWIEQFTFLLGMFPTLIKRKPHVIYYSDFILGAFLWRVRFFFKFRYKLLFSNGAPNGPPFSRMDHVQQLLPMYIKQAIRAGTPARMQTLLPYGIHIDPIKSVELTNSKLQLLNQLELPINKKIVICVGAVNSHHKRIDYLINEFSLLDSQIYFLVVLGQIDELSLPIIEQARTILSDHNFLIRQVNSLDVTRYLCVSDYFVLPSLHEGLPRVLPEALGAGLLPIVHDYEVTRETLLDYGVFIDMTLRGVLQDAIQEVDNKLFSKDEMIKFAFNTYSWTSLSARYEKMIAKTLV